MNEDIEKLREIYLTDVDEETREQNLQDIQAFEASLHEAEEYASWHGHDVTRRIMEQARKSYVEQSLTLARRRDLSPEERSSLHAKQDAMLWFLSLTESDPKQLLAQIEADIRRALTQAS